MASRILEVIFQARDQATATLGKVQQGLGGFKASAERMAKGVSDSLNSMVGRWLSVGAIAGVLKTASDAANELSASMRKLEGTAKIAGVPLETLQAIAAKGKEAFGLSAVTVNDLTVAVSKLATKAGDLGMSSDLMERFLDLGAAKGLSATDTLKAVEQSILGIDEGTDKLFGKNPSVLYEEFAASIGKSAGKLSDQEKAMAIATAAMEDGGKVVGAYRDYLQSAAGQQDQARQKMKEAAATLGTALTPAFAAAAEMVQWTGEQIQAFIGSIQIMAVELSAAAMALGPMFKFIAGGVLTMLGDMFDKLRDLPLVGDLFAGVADRLKTTGQQMVATNRQALANIRDAMDEEKAKIVGIEISGGRRQLQAAKDTQGALTTTTTDGGGKRSKAEEATQKEIERLERESAVRQIQINEGLTEKQAEEAYRRKELLEGATTAQRDRLTALWREMDEANLLLAAGFNDQVVPKVERTTTEFGALKRILDRIPESLEPVRTKTVKVADSTDEAAAKAAKFRDDLRTGVTAATGFASGLGLISDAAANVVNQLVAVGANIGKALSGDVTSIAGVLGGLTGILGTIFGGDKARAEIVRKNTEALRTLTTAVGDFAKLTTPGGKVATAQSFVAGFLKEFEAITPKLRPGQSMQDALAEQTARRSSLLKSFGARALGAGLSMEDIDQIAKDLGINIRDPKGNVSASGLQSLLTGLGLIEPGFANTYQGQLDRITKGLGIGAITQGQEFTQLLGAIGIGGENAITRALAGADFGTAEGRAAAAVSLRDLFTNIGTLSAADFGGLNQAEFLDAIGRLIEILADPERVIDPVATGTLDQPPLNLSNAFGDLTVAFEDIGTQQVDYLSSIDTNIGELLTRWTDIDTGQAVGLAAAPVTITVGDINIASATDPAATADAVQQAVADALNQALADSYLDRQLATGNVTRTVS